MFYDMFPQEFFQNNLKFMLSTIILNSFSISLFHRTVRNSLIEYAVVQVEEGGEGSLVSHEESSVSLSLPMDLNLLILIFSATLLSVLFFCLLILIVMLKLSQINKKELAILHIFFKAEKVSFLILPLS